MRRHMIKLILAALPLVFSSCFASAETKLVKLYTYHNVPPFITGGNTGLTYDLAGYLNRNAVSTGFEVVIMPRKRIDLLLKSTRMVVPWVTPAWFGKHTGEIFSWTGPIMNDGSVYIWKTGRFPGFSKPDDLIGRTLGGIRGYKYVGVDPLVRNGRISRSDVSSEQQLLKQLLLERVDVGIVPRSGGRFLLRKHGWEHRLSFTTHHSYQRRFLINRHPQPILIELNRLSRKMISDPAWAAIMHRYGLDARIDEKQDKASSSS